MMQNYLYCFVALMLLSYMSEALAEQNTSLGQSPSRGISFVSRDDVNINESRIALVIGNAKYQYINTLRNPRNDALAMKHTLTKLGFNVVFVANANYQQMEHAVHMFGEKLKQTKGVGLFYYAGHGVQIDGGNYLLPIDLAFEQRANLSVLKSQSLPLTRVLRQMDTVKEQLKLVILDACRENPFSSESRNLSWHGLKRGLAKVDAPSGTYIAYATAPGKLAADGGRGRNGLYTKHLLENITKANMVVEQMFKLVRQGVMLETNNQQVPWDSSSLVGDFYFVPDNSELFDKDVKQQANDLCSLTRGAQRPLTCLLGSNQ